MNNAIFEHENGVFFLRFNGLPAICPWTRGARANDADRECGSWCPFFAFKHNRRGEVMGAMLRCAGRDVEVRAAIFSGRGDVA